MQCNAMSFEWKEEEEEEKRREKQQARKNAPQKT